MNSLCQGSLHHCCNNWAKNPDTYKKEASAFLFFQCQGNLLEDDLQIGRSAALQTPALLTCPLSSTSLQIHQFFKHWYDEQSWQSSVCLTGLNCWLIQTSNFTATAARSSHCRYVQKHNTFAPEVSQSECTQPWAHNCSLAASTHSKFALPVEYASQKSRVYSRHLLEVLVRRTSSSPRSKFCPQHPFPSAHSKHHPTAPSFPPSPTLLHPSLPGQAAPPLAAGG